MEKKLLIEKKVRHYVIYRSRKRCCTQKTNQHTGGGSRSICLRSRLYRYSCSGFYDGVSDQDIFDDIRKKITSFVGIFLYTSKFMSRCYISRDGKHHWQEADYYDSMYEQRYCKKSVSNICESAITTIMTLDGVALFFLYNGGLLYCRGQILYMEMHRSASAQYCLGDVGCI